MEVNPLGPLQLYVAPAIALVVREIVDPAQTGLLLEATGVAGMGLTTTFVVAGELVQPATVAVTEYVPAFAVVAAGIEGFCNAELKEFGPVQL